jgi:hypothetical protein
LVDEDEDKITWKDTPLPLVNVDGTGKYAGIITTTNNFVYQVILIYFYEFFNPIIIQFDDGWKSVMHDAHWLQIDNYLLKYPSILVLINISRVNIFTLTYLVIELSMCACMLSRIQI